jgi:YVTN family beta-propeller protein
MAHVIDTTSFKLIANVLVDTRPRAVLYEDSGKRFWVTSEVGGTLAVIDAATYKVTKKIGFEIEGVRSELIQPLGIRFSKDGKRGFVALGRANRIAVIDVESLVVTNYILVGQRPWHMELSPDGSKLYAANGLTNDVTIVDVPTLRAEKSVPVGRLPWGIAIKP